jgi:hypothetical protein
VIQAARIIANAQAQSLSATPNPVVAYNTLIGGLPGFAGGTSSIPAGFSLVGEEGPELLMHTGGATQVIPLAGRFATGTALPHFSGVPRTGGPDSTALLAKIEQVLAQILNAQGQTTKQVYAAQMTASGDARQTNQHLANINAKTAPPLSAPARRAVT